MLCRYFGNKINIPSSHKSLNDSLQIIEPHDRGISEAILRNLEPKSWDMKDVTSSALFEDVTAKMENLYFEELTKLSLSRHVTFSSLEHRLMTTLNRALNGTTSVKFVNTSMHGVSDRFVSTGFSAFGFPAYVPVAEQQHPDPEFPTVRFPNPEEKGKVCFHEQISSVRDLVPSF